jgi:hypothetical protein
MVRSLVASVAIPGHAVTGDLCAAVHMIRQVDIRSSFDMPVIEMGTSSARIFVRRTEYSFTFDLASDRHGAFPSFWQELRSSDTWVIINLRV